MKDRNIYSCTGRLTRDPETVMVGDSSVTNFAVAVNDEYTKDGEKHNNVTYIDWDAWNGTGKFIQDYCKKGDFVLVDGQYKQTVKEVNGETKRYHRFRVEKFQKLSWDNSEKKEPSVKPVRKGRDVKPPEDSEDDLPF